MCVCVCVGVDSKQTVLSDAKYSFLRALVANVPDIHSVTAADDDKELNQQQQQPPTSARRDVTSSRPRGRYANVLSVNAIGSVTCIHFHTRMLASL